MATQETLLNGRYRLISQQGSGGMAVVYKAQDLALGRTVAIKILRPSLTGDASFLTRFRQEARNVANLAHPNIVTLHDFGQDGNTYYMVMEYIDGQDLKKVIRASAPFSVERMLHISIQICAGIGYAHRAGLVHADVKPQNILLTGNDVVKITDFGIAQALAITQPQEKQSVVWGSPHYFAPEQASGEMPSPAADVYAIGIVMFEMLTGKLPYSGADQQELALAHIREQVPHVIDMNPNVPVHLDRIIFKVMSKEPSARYRTADQLGRILITYQKQGQDVTANVATPPPAPPSPTVTSAAAAARSDTSPKPVPYIPQSSGTPIPTFKSGSSPAQPTGSGKPQVPYVPPAAPQPGYNPNPPASNRPPGNVVPAPYVPPRPQNAAALYRSGGPDIPESFSPPPVNPYVQPNSSSPNYQLPTQQGVSIDSISIVLGLIAFVAILGLIVLWVAVLNAYSRG